MRWVILYKSTQFNLWNYARYIVEKSRIGESIIDFGRGGYDYKMSNFRPQIENLYRLWHLKPSGATGMYCLRLLHLICVKL